MNQSQMLALKLTAFGLSRGKSYEWKGVSVYPIKGMYGGITWQVTSSDGALLTTNHPLEAAIKFMQLVKILKSPNLP
jgi:hypothetical protein